MPPVTPCKSVDVNMNTHALAFVNYKYFRSSPENRKKFSKAYYYISKKCRIVELVGNGGTLWVVTSAPSSRGRIYSLAYKLVRCEPFEVWENLGGLFGEYGVIGDPKDSRHYPRNDMTELLLNFDFSPKKPIKNTSVIGISLMTARKLAPDDVLKLQDYEDKLLHGRHVFISYSSRDSEYADILQNILEANGHKVWRDLRSIVGGEEWEPAIYRAIKNADAFILLISNHSVGSTWVRKETQTALNLYGMAGKLQRLVPVVLSAEAWAAFPEVNPFQKREWTEISGNTPHQIASELKDIQV